MLDLNVFSSTKSQTRCHANTRRCVFLQTSSHGVSQLSKKIASPQELTRTNSCRVKLTFTTAQRSWFLRSRPTSHARSSQHQQTTSGRPPFFVEVCPRSITTANQVRQLLSGPNQFQMHVSRSLNVVELRVFQTVFDLRSERLHCRFTLLTQDRSRWSHVTLLAKIAILHLVLGIILPNKRHPDHVSNCFDGAFFGELCEHHGVLLRNLYRKG